MCPGEVYDNVVADFSRWYITLAYTRRVVAVGLPRPARRVERPADPRPLQRPDQTRYKAIALVFAVVLTAGFLAVPFAVQFGLVGAL